MNRWLLGWALLCLYLCALDAATGLRADGQEFVAGVGLAISVAGLAVSMAEVLARGGAR